MIFPNRERAVAARSAGFCSLSFLFFFLLLVGVPVADAQSAALGGIVMDPASAVVPNAGVTLTNERTSVVQQAKTNGTGLYTIPFLQPGKYTLAVEAPGFKRYERTGITIETAQTVAIDVKLQIGSTSESVAVRGDGNYINSTDASVSTVIDRQFVENIPLNGRSFQSLMTQVPGVLVVPSTGVGQSGEISVNGQRTEANYFTVDGVSATTGAIPYSPGSSAGYSGSLAGETVLGTTQSLVSIDALQEFRATTSTYSAEYGRTPGGQFTFTTRSGTNEWHGSAFDYLRNDALDANNWFNNYYGEARQAERQNDFGGTLGGPVRIPGLYNGKDRTFFFFSYEGLRLTQPQAAQEYEVPSLTVRSEAATALQPYFNAFPVPGANALSSPDPGLLYYTAGYVSPSSLDTSSVRIDHNFSDRFKIFGRFSYAPSNTMTRANNGNLANTLTQHGDLKTFTFGSTNIINSHFSNEARFNVTWNDSRQAFDVDDFGGATPLHVTDIPGYTSSDWLYLYVNYGLYPGIRFAPQTDQQQQWNVTDTVSATIDRHNLKWGIDFRRLRTDGTLPLNYQGVAFASTDEMTNNAPSFFVNYHSQGGMSPIYTNFSAFAQDDWKVNQRLNLSLGLRWELNPAPHDANGNNPYTVTSTDVASTEVAPKGTPLWHTTYGNFAPRLGFSYQLHQQPGHETVLRAGTGLFYDLGNNLASSGYFFGVGITSRTSFAGTPFPLTPAQLEAIPAPSAAAPYNSEVFGFDPNLKLPYTWQWNVALEQALGENQSLILNYVASAGRHLLQQKEYDPTVAGNSSFASGGNGLYLTTNAASSDYNALQVQFKRRLSHGLQALLSYTWAHAFDDASTNFQVLTAERAASDNDIRNNFQAAVTYDIPGRYSSRVVSAIFKQWSVDARVSARSSLPLDIFGTTYALDGTGTTLNYHPNRVSGEPLYVRSAGAPGGRLVNYNAFTVATDANGNYVEGDFPRNGVRGFDAVQADIALRRDFTFRKSIGLQFRAEAFNVLNHPIYGSIYPYLSDGASLFGMAYQTQNSSLGGLSPLYQVGGPRSLQVALRLHF